MPSKQREVEYDNGWLLLGFLLYVNTAITSGTQRDPWPRQRSAQLGAGLSPISMLGWRSEKTKHGHRNYDDIHLCCTTACKAGKHHDDQTAGVLVRVQVPTLLQPTVRLLSTILTSIRLSTPLH